MTVNKVNMRKWIDALRSEEYAQGSQMLRTDMPGASKKKMCCLGVAQDVLGDGEWVLPTHECDLPGCTVTNWTFFEKEGASEQSHLTPAVAQALGVTQNPVVALSFSGGTITATQANDSFCWNFKKIANALEEMYLSDEEEENADVRTS